MGTRWNFSFLERPNLGAGQILTIWTLFWPNLGKMIIIISLFLFETLHFPPLWLRQHRCYDVIYVYFLAERVAQKTGQRYDHVMTWMRCKLSFLIMRSALLCLRGSRSVKMNSNVTEDFDLACDDARLWFVIDLFDLGAWVFFRMEFYGLVSAFSKGFFWTGFEYIFFRHT